MHWTGLFRRDHVGVLCVVQRLSGRMNIDLKIHPSSAQSPFHSFFGSYNEISVGGNEYNIQINRHTYHLYCRHGVATHHRFNHRTSPLHNFTMISIDSASFSNHRSHLHLEVVGAILWPNRCGYGFGRNLRRI